MPLSRLVALPFGLAFALLVYWLLTDGDSTYSWWLIPLGAILVSIYIFHHQINWWGYKRKPPKLDPSVIKLYMMHLPFLSYLNREEMDRFFMRAALWVKSKEFLTKALKEFPEDIKYMIAAFPIFMTLKKEHFYLHPYDRIVAYPHPFLSPQFEDDIHTVEHEDKDGVFIFSLEHMLPGFIQKGRYYNIVCHEFGTMFKKAFPENSYPDTSNITWSDIEAIGPFSKEKIETLLGIPVKDFWPVLVHHYCYYRENFSKVNPKLFAEIHKVFDYS